MGVLDDILSQPEAWHDTLAELEPQLPAVARLAAEPSAEVIYTGCGSTYYLTVSAAALHRRLLGRAVRALSAGEIVLGPAELGSSSLMFALSRSGRTTETVRAAELQARLPTGKLTTVTCRPGTELAALADVAVELPSAFEPSVAQTRSFSSMWLAATAIIARLAANEQLVAELSRLPAVCRELIERARPLATELATDRQIERVYVLGSGLQHGLACEGALLMKELALTDGEAFHFLDFRHGPISMVDDRTLVIGLLGEREDALELDVMRDVQRNGGGSLLIAESPPALDGAASLELGSGCHALARSPLFMPPLQLLALELTLAAGRDPEQPRNLAPVIEIPIPGQGSDIRDQT